MKKRIRRVNVIHQDTVSVQLYHLAKNLREIPAEARRETYNYLRRESDQSFSMYRYWVKTETETQITKYWNRYKVIAALASVLEAIYPEAAEDYF